MFWKRFSVRSLLAMVVLSTAVLSGCTKADDVQTSVIAEESATTTPSSDSGSNQAVTDMKNQMKNDLESYSGRTRELKTVPKEADLSKINSLMDQWKAELDKLQMIANQNDPDSFWNSREALDDVSTEVNDAFAAAYSSSNFASAKNQALKDKPKQLKDIQRQLKDLQRNTKDFDEPADTSALQNYISQMEQHIATMKQLAGQTVDTSDRDALDDAANAIWDAIRDFDDVSQDFYDTINDMNEGVWDKQRVQDARKNLRDKERTIKDLTRETKRLSKNFDDSNEQMAEVTRIFTEMQSVLDQIKAAVESSDSETLNLIENDFWDLNGEIWDYINELNEIQGNEQQSDDTARNLKDKKQWHKDKERECKRVKCEETEAGNIIQQMRDMLAQMEEAVNEGRFQDYWDMEREYNDLDPSFWEFVGQKQSEKDIRRWLKDTSREWKDKGRWIADMEREAKKGSNVVDEDGVARLQEIHDKAIEEIHQAEEFYKQNNYDEARYLLEDLNELRAEFDEITGGFNQGREMEYFEFELEHLGEELDRGEETIEEKLENGEIDQAKADLCTSYIEQGRDYLDQLEQIKEDGDVGGEQEVMLRLENLGNQADRDCGDVFEETGDSYQTFNEFWVPEDLQGVADEILGRLSGDLEQRIMDRLLERLSGVTSQFNDVLERFGQRFDEIIAKKLEAISFISEEYQEELLSRTAEIFEKVEQVEGSASRLAQPQQDRFNRIRDEILNYNFYGNSASDVEDHLQEFENSSLSDSDIAALESRIQQVKQEAVVEKFELGIIPFRDTDDNQWYTAYVASVAEKGIVNGKSDAQGNPTGYYDPGANVTVGEMLKMSLEAAGLGEEGGEPSLVAARNHWARGYVKRAEILGLDIVSGLDNLDRPATRAEIVKTALQARGVVPEAVSSSSYADVPSNHPAINYIVEATNMGIVKGDSTGNTFRPEAFVNRAETAKIINNVAEAGGNQ